MCGIAGFWLSSLSTSDNLQHLIDPMVQKLKHRGPDEEGSWIDNSLKIALGHRRLSILDLSESGSQPMESAKGLYILSYNGEIYNHEQIRRDINLEFPDYQWRGTSDTETILAAFDIYGIEKTLELCSGMFAMAIWDINHKKLFLVRDRFGEKPLYYFANNKNIIFASELKALRESPHYSFILDLAGMKNYIKRGYLDESHCIDSGTKKVLPGQVVVFDHINRSANKSIYWSHSSFVKKENTKKSRANSFNSNALKVENVLSEIVSSQMISDVPLGSFLSGGIDSSLITTLMQKNSDIPIKTFTVGFEEDVFNESQYAEEISRYLGTEHTSFILKESDAINLIPEIASIYDEPFADYSQIPTILLAREAKKHVSVVLTGDGGDEIFGGYNRHVMAPMLWNFSRIFPSVVKKSFFSFLSRYHNQRNIELSNFRFFLKRFGLSPQLLLKASNLSQILSRANSYPDLYDQLTSIFYDPDELIIKKDIENENNFLKDYLDSNLSKSRWMMLMDSLIYLPGDILTKVDRASMSASLETRAPFLDRRVVEVASDIDTKHLIRNRQGKYILRHILSKHLPQHLFERPKQGFTIPLDKWLREELREWCEDLLSSKKIKEFNIFEPNIVKKLWEDHIHHNGNHAAKLWAILVFQSWLEQWGDLAIKNLK